MSEQEIRANWRGALRCLWLEIGRTARLFEMEAAERKKYQVIV